MYREERNVPGCSSWIVRCGFDMGKYEWSCEDERKQESLLMIDEKVYSVLEYVRNKMLVSIAYTNLLVVHNWKPVKLIQKNSHGNIYKNFFMTLPDFDEQTFPFIACSGFEHISLVNVKDLIMQVFIQCPCKTVKSQQAFFFQDEKYGYSMHFCSKANDGSKEYH